MSRDYKRSIRIIGPFALARHRVHEMRRRLRRSFEKNLPDAKTLLTGRMPAFITRRGADPGAEVPVFVFHDVGPDRFEKQLRHLRDNGYETLSAGELAAAARGERSGDRTVALTFDDATATFWSYAFPMLRQFGMRAILFVIPGLVPEDPTPYPSFNDIWGRKASVASVERRRTVQPLCTWQELGAIRASGLVDIGSHSLSHACIAVSPRIIDFIHPRIETELFHRIDVPRSALESRDPAARELPLGAPIFESAPRLAGRPRFVPSPELVTAMLDHVDSHGGISFFTQPTWRRDLARIAKQWPRAERGDFETAADAEAAMAYELVESKRQLERRLEGEQVRHFCYPWFSGCHEADRLAAQIGYQCMHYGIDYRADAPRSDDVVRIRRLSERYLTCLPGRGRRSLGRTLVAEATERVRGLHAPQPHSLSSPAGESRVRGKREVA